MNRNDLKLFLSQNLLTSSQASDALGMSKQLLAHYVKNGMIEPIFETTQGFLYLKSDLDRFNLERVNRILGNSSEAPSILFCRKGVTQKCIDFFVENQSFLEDITCVSIYFEEFDAILNGDFQKSSANEMMPGMFSLEVPHMVIRDVNGKEIWLSGCNCGYSGTGPNGTKKILDMIGVLPELSNNVYYYNVLHYYFDKDSGWQVRCGNSGIRESKSSAQKYKAEPVFADIVMHNDHLVLLERSYQNNFYDVDPKPFLEKYSLFVPHPLRILLLTKEQAKDLGYINRCNLGEAQIYNLIIIDGSGRELWLSIDIDDHRPFHKQYTLLDLLQRCGFEVISTDTLSDKIKKWLGLMPIHTSICELKKK